MCRCKNEECKHEIQVHIVYLNKEHDLIELYCNACSLICEADNEYIDLAENFTREINVNS